MVAVQLRRPRCLPPFLLPLPGLLVRACCPVDPRGGCHLMWLLPDDPSSHLVVARRRRRRGPHPAQLGQDQGQEGRVCHPLALSPLLAHQGL